MDKRQSGFTLIEIFIALAIGLSLMAGVMSVFVGMKTTTVETSSFGELQENGRFAMSLITEDLLRQNLWGDFTGMMDKGALTTAPNPADSPGDCVGGGVNNASFPYLVGHFRTLWGQTVNNSSPLGCITNAKINSDLIQLKRVLASPFPDTALDPLTPVDLDNGRFYLKSNANTAAIFTGAVAIPTVNLGRVWEYQHHIYYVREDAQGGNSVPVLVQGRLQNSNTKIMTFDMMVEGIEKLYFMYGVDTDNDGAVNAFISSDNMTQDYWDNANDVRILAVKIFILVRNILPDSKYINNNVYQIGDSSFDPNGDNYRRLLFSSTVTLYNARVDTW